MPKRFHLTRPVATKMTKDGYRRLRSFAADADLDEGEALSFLFENLGQILRTDTVEVKLRMFKECLEERKK